MIPVRLRAKLFVAVSLAISCSSPSVPLSSCPGRVACSEPEDPLPYCCNVGASCCVVAATAGCCGADGGFQ
jgi:hypothetical protein